MHRKVHFDYFTLDDIYVQLCGSYKTVTSAIGNKIKTIVNTDEWLLDWIDDQSNMNNIMLVTGKPASGKTTLLKKVACELASKLVKVVWIPLKNFSLSPNVYNDVGAYCTRYIGHNPLEFLGRNERLVLLLCGLS